jgi:uncharacterized protein YijF (DUF1287 family)
MKRLRWIIAAACILAAGCAGIFIYSHLQYDSSGRPPNRYLLRIEQVRSSSDKDGDGIDDQTDILKSALAYVATKPKYMSKYYATGYPNDGYGVCTDVVANALKNSGYDIMNLIEADIAAHPGDYDIKVPDAKIDFRRVRNLKVYFRHTAIALTTDVKQIKQWQGGDIVIFHDHIGIVSDRRNIKGIPYVIHHSGVLQVSYEQDILEGSKDIEGHYRVSE